MEQPLEVEGRGGDDVDDGQGRAEEPMDRGTEHRPDQLKCLFILP